MRQVILYPGEDGFWVAECPTLPGCISQGKSKEDAVINIQEAILGIHFGATRGRIVCFLQFVKLHETAQTLRDDDQ